MEIPAIILAGILRVESSTVMTHFGPARVGAAPRGKHGERGVMQVRYDAFREVALPGEKWSDMDWNHHLSTAIGCRYLIKLYNRFKCWDKAVMAYNAGASNYEAGKPYLKKVKDSIMSIIDETRQQAERQKREDDLRDALRCLPNPSSGKEK